MTQHETIRSVVATFLGVDAGQLGPDHPLAGRLRNSIDRAGLQARLHRALGRMPPPLVDVATYGQLERQLLGEPAAPPIAAASAGGPGSAAHDGRGAARMVDAATGIACGIDIEAVDNLPHADDYWTHPFYADTFSPAEIADCVRHSAPREHFAARWCAKEALIKCAPAFRREKLAAIEVRADDTGQPRLFDLSEHLPRPLPVAVSLTHAGGFAAALVVTVGPASTGPFPPRRDADRAASAGPRSDARIGFVAWAALAAATAALLTALGAWVR